MEKQEQTHFEVKAFAAAVIVALLAFGICLAYWLRVEDAQRRDLDATLRQEAQQASVLLVNQFNAFDLVARSVKGFIEGSEAVTAEEFKSFTASLNLPHVTPGLHNVGVAWLVSSTDAVERSSQLLLKKSPLETGPAGSEYAPLLYMAPAQSISRTIGQDILADPLSRVPARMAAETRQLVAGGKTQLTDPADGIQHLGYTLFLPVYEPSDTTEGAAAWPQGPEGWVVLSFRLADLLAPLGKSLQSGLQLRFMDGAQDGLQVLSAYANGEPVALAQAAMTGAQYSIREVTRFAGRDWVFHVDAPSSFIAQYMGNSHSWIAMAGCLLGICMGMIAYLLMTARYRAERLAFDMTARMRRIAGEMSDTLNAIPDLLFEMDQDVRYLQLRTANGDDLLLPPEQLIGKSAWDVMPSKAAVALKMAIDEAHAQGRSTGTRIELEIQGQPRWFELSVARKTHMDSGSERFIVLSRDITERALAEKKIHQLAFFDSLTGLPNRVSFLAQAREILASLAPGGYSALLMLDIDNFKNINDQWGHAMGDALLKTVAARIQAAVGYGALVARFGGDEFIVFIRDIGTGHAEARQVIESICKSMLTELSHPIRIEEYEFFTSLSVGVVLVSQEAVAIGELISRADSAMYQAKANGKNTFSFYDSSLQKELLERSALEHDMRIGLSSGQFFLVYQPQVNHLGQIIGAEALCRWQHPYKGLIAPQRFIDIAEKNGFIFQLGSWVLQQACATLAVWQKDPDLCHLRIAINVSSQQFHHPDFVDQLIQMIAASAVDPGKIELELTESSLSHDVDVIAEKMRQLKSLGIYFSLDDFGTGYSSLAYIKRLPLDQLKIDQSFVRDVIVDSNDAAIVQTIISLGDNLGLHVIAEGVENAGQHQFLMQNRCLNFQGYLFSRPLGVVDFESHVKTRYPLSPEPLAGEMQQAGPAVALSHPAHP